MMPVAIRSRRASAILLVLAVLAMVAVLAMTFAMLARLDSRIGRNFGDDLTTEREIGDHGVEYISALLAADPDERLPAGAYSAYDAVDDKHRWLAGIRLDPTAPAGYSQCLSFRDRDDWPTTPAQRLEFFGEFNVTGAGTPYDGSSGSDINQDGILDGPNWAWDGRYMTGAGASATGFDITLDPQGREHIECAAIIYDLESRLNVNVIGNTSGPGETHGFAEGWAPHEISLLPLDSWGIFEPIFGGDGVCKTTANSSAPADDVQLVAVDDPALPGQMLVGPGANGILETAPGGDDQIRTRGELLEYLLVTGERSPVAPYAPVIPYIGRCGLDGLPGTAGNDDPAETPDPFADRIDNNADGVADGAFIIEPYTGGNGLCNTTAAPDDTQLLPVGSKVLPGDRLIDPGLNRKLDTLPPGGDDAVTGTIREPFTGGDGKANVPAASVGGDDVLYFALNTNVPPGTIIVSPGPDGVLQTAPAGDDAVFAEATDEPNEMNPYVVLTVIMEPLSGGDGLRNTGPLVADDTWYDGSTGAYPGPASLPPGWVIVRPGPNRVLDTLPGGDDAVGLADLPFGVEDDIDLASSLVHLVEVVIEPLTGGNGKCNTTADLADVQVVALNADVAPGTVLVRPGADLILNTVPPVPPAGDDMRVKMLLPGSRLAQVLSHPWARHLIADLDADTINNNMNLDPAGNEVPDETSEAAAQPGPPPVPDAPTIAEARRRLTNLVDDNNPVDALIDNPSEGEDTLFRKLFTAVSCGDVWARRAANAPVPPADGAYPLDAFVNNASSPYELCKIPVNRINWGEDLYNAGNGFALNTSGNDASRLLLDVFNAARYEWGTTAADRRDAAGLVVNLVDAFDRRQDASGARANESITVMLYDNTGTLAPEPILVELIGGGDLNDDSVIDNVDRAPREKFYDGTSLINLNAWIDAAVATPDDVLVQFGYEDRLPRISQLYCVRDPDLANDQYAVEIYNPEPFDVIDLANWQLAVFSSAGARLRFYTFQNTHVLAKRDDPVHDGTFVVGNNKYAGTKDAEWSTDAGWTDDLTFNDDDRIVLVRRFVPVGTGPESGVVGAQFHGIVIDVAAVPTLAARPVAPNPPVTDNKMRYRGWRCDQWDDYVGAGDGMKAHPEPDDCYPNGAANPGKLQLWFPDDPTTRMTNLGDFGRIVDFQLALYQDGTDTLPAVTDAERAFSRNLASSIQDSGSGSPAAWDERWAVFYQFWARVEPPAPNDWKRTSTDGSDLGTLMELLTIPAPHADGLDNDGDGAVDLADTGSQAGDRWGPEVRVPGQVNVNTASREVLRCLLSPLELAGSAPKDPDTFIAKLEAGRPYKKLSDFLDDTKMNLSTVENAIESSSDTVDDDGDGYVNEPNEALFLRARLSNLVTTRSNTFLAFLATRYIDEGARRLGIMAGSDGDCDSTAAGDDVQVVAVGTTGLSPNFVVILPGPNRILDTPADVNDVCTAGINEPLVNGNGIADTARAGDDVQIVPVSSPVLPGQCVIGPGPDGVISPLSVPAGDEAGVALIIEPWTGGNGTCNSTAAGDDIQLVPVGDPCSPGQVLIDPGPNRVLDTAAAGGDDVRLVHNGALAIRERLGVGNNRCDTQAVGDDIQVVAYNVAGATSPGQILILPGPNGRIDSTPNRDAAGNPTGGDDGYDLSPILAGDDSVFVRREIVIFDRAACARNTTASPNVWVPQVRVLARKLVGDYRKVPQY